MTELNVFQHFLTLTCADGPFYSPKNAAVDDPKYLRRRFWPFPSLWIVRSS